MQFPGFLRLVLPTFFLLSAFAGRAFHSQPRHRQVFGNHDYFMELWFDASPSITRQRTLPYLKFEGEFVSDNSNERLTGYLARQLGKTTYHFKVGSRQWEGVLRATPNSCDGMLELSDLRTGKPIPTEHLKAGFCVQL